MPESSWGLSTLEKRYFLVSVPLLSQSPSNCPQKRPASHSILPASSRTPAGWKLSKTFVPLTRWVWKKIYLIYSWALKCQARNIDRQQDKTVLHPSTWKCLSLPATFIAWIFSVVEGKALFIWCAIRENRISGDTRLKQGQDYRARESWGWFLVVWTEAALFHLNQNLQSGYQKPAA